MRPLVMDAGQESPTGLLWAGLASIGAGLDAAFAAWESAPEREPHDRIVERFALGIGEHLHRHTDLRWQLVTDAFGSDLRPFMM